MQCAEKPGRNADIITHTCFEGLEYSRPSFLNTIHLTLPYVTGFGKMCIVLTSDFAHSKVLKHDRKSLNFAGVIEG